MEVIGGPRRNSPETGNISHGEKRKSVVISVGPTLNVDAERLALLLCRGLKISARRPIILIELFSRHMPR